MNILKSSSTVIEMAACNAKLSTFLLRNLIRNEIAFGRLFSKHELVTVASSSLEIHGCQWSNYWLFVRNRRLLTQQYVHPGVFYSSDKSKVDKSKTGLDRDTVKNLSSVNTQQSVRDNATSSGQDGTDGSANPESGEKLSVFQRFKKTYKEHGKVLIAVHLATSAVWFGSFFYAAKVGVDVVPFLEWCGLSEKIIGPFRNSSLGDVALAYLMYKLATPARYTVTLTGTNFAIQYLRKTGRMQPKCASTSLRTLAKESRTKLREKRHKIIARTRKEVIQRQRKFASKMKERQGKVKDKMRARISEFRARWNKPRRGQKKTGPKK